MPKLPGYLLRWSEANQIYELISHDYVEHRFRPDDELVWLDFLETHTSFTFQGREGRLSVMKEARPRGAGYWYAYRVTERRTNKHYLGKTTNVTTTRLEEAARALNRVTSSMPVREQAFAAGSLLLPKLQPPRLPSTLVERSRLLQRLDTALERKLTLLVAPAGYGKTTLVINGCMIVRLVPGRNLWPGFHSIEGIMTCFASGALSLLRVRCSSHLWGKLL